MANKTGKASKLSLKSAKRRASESFAGEDPCEGGQQFQKRVALGSQELRTVGGIDERTRKKLYALLFKGVDVDGPLPPLPPSKLTEHPPKTSGEESCSDRQESDISSRSPPLIWTPLPPPNLARLTRRAVTLEDLCRDRTPVTTCPARPGSRDPVLVNSATCRTNVATTLPMSVRPTEFRTTRVGVASSASNPTAAQDSETKENGRAVVSSNHGPPQFTDVKPAVRRKISGKDGLPLRLTVEESNAAQSFGGEDTNTIDRTHTRGKSVSDGRDSLSFTQRTVNSDAVQCSRKPKSRVELTDGHNRENYRTFDDNAELTLEQNSTIAHSTLENKIDRNHNSLGERNTVLSTNQASFGSGAPSTTSKTNCTGLPRSSWVPAHSSQASVHSSGFPVHSSAVPEVMDRSLHPSNDCPDPCTDITLDMLLDDDSSDSDDLPPVRFGPGPSAASRAVPSGNQLSVSGVRGTGMKGGDMETQQLTRDSPSLVSSHVPGGGLKSKGVKETGKYGTISSTSAITSSSFPSNGRVRGEREGTIELPNSCPECNTMFPQWYGQMEVDRHVAECMCGDLDMNDFIVLD